MQYFILRILFEVRILDFSQVVALDDFDAGAGERRMG
jgi:hypothetical protein